MILIVGGEGSGKRAFAENLGYSQDEISEAVIDERPVVCRVERMVAADYKAAPKLLEPLSAKEVVICCEVGSGIIPAEYEQRLTREATGRLCVQLAQRAEAVVRMVCGIPNVIKGKLP